MIHLVLSAKKVDINCQIIFEHIVWSIKVVFKLADLINFEAQITRKIECSQFEGNFF
jgi:hypothetical protein